ncbi:hypothetical protein BGW36DRAFT_386039 [Talaromyces proteolyticus]|uniref:Ankyrin repeat protein n=1 Tax=Talaromyces proteolyticus TaxID=1131652 RepID=A0AAD4KLY9_9EURO|nr:uncharacterized protein BGW36DRAFT_386039 [Talaromyces proteolyticus]KAH8693162.1 hypothetical protein BGW36DRAFT_386039 [Talaromyces proteolyticus]
MSFRTGILEYLIASGADINAQGSDGLTPLETAAYRNPCNVMVKMLLDAGARNPWVESGLIEMTICDTSDEDDDEYDYY